MTNASSSIIKDVSRPCLTLAIQIIEIMPKFKYISKVDSSSRKSFTICSRCTIYFTLLAKSYLSSKISRKIESSVFKLLVSAKTPSPFFHGGGLRRFCSPAKTNRWIGIFMVLENILCSVWVFSSHRQPGPVPLQKTYNQHIHINRSCITKKTSQVWTSALNTDEEVGPRSAGKSFWVGSDTSVFDAVICKGADSEETVII